MPHRSPHDRTLARRLRDGVTALGLAAAVTASGCASLSPQLGPTDLAALERIKDRETREQSYTDNSIYRHHEPQGVRYTKGNAPATVKRSWQSLDVILRSDQNSSAALPVRKLRAARVLTALTLASSMLLIAGAAASSREGLDFKDLTGGGLLLLSGGVLTVGFAIGAGVSYNQARKGYDRAVDVYNESLGMRLGVLDAEGEYRPPPGVQVDENGYVILNDQGIIGPAVEGPVEAPDPSTSAPLESTPTEAPAPEAPPTLPPPARGEAIALMPPR